MSRSKIYPPFDYTYLRIRLKHTWRKTTTPQIENHYHPNYSINRVNIELLV